MTGRIGIAAALIMIGATAVSAQESTENQGKNNLPEGARAAPQAGWTLERMRSATETVLPEVVAEAPTGGEAPAPAAPGELGADDLVPQDRPARQSGNIFDKPLYWAGKLFYTKPEGDYMCSAQFISPQVLLTAAHCVRDADTGEFYDDFLFALQYSDGRYAGLYEYECVATKQGWLLDDSERYPYDYATMLVDGTSRTGHFGTRWDYGDSYDFAYKIGFPSALEGGEIIQVERGPMRLTNGLIELEHGSMVSQGGSSGGAWLVDYPSGNYIISVQSHSYESHPGVSYGPYLDSSFKSLWDYTENDCRE